MPQARIAKEEQDAALDLQLEEEFAKEQQARANHKERLLWEKRNKDAQLALAQRHHARGRAHGGRLT